MWEGDQGEEFAVKRQSMHQVRRLLPMVAPAVSITYWWNPQAAHGQTIFVSVSSGQVGQYIETGSSITSSNSSFISDTNDPEGLAISGTNLYVTNFSDASVGEYSAISGTGTAAFATADMNEPLGIGVSGSNLYVGNFGINSGDDVNKYNASTGAVIINQYITGLSGPAELAISGSNLYVNNAEGGSVTAYNLTANAPLAGFSLTGLSSNFALAIYQNDLFVANESSGVVSEFNATTGASISPSFISSGLGHPTYMTVFGSDLYILDAGKDDVAEYDVSSGSAVAVNTSLITGLINPQGILVTVVPEPSRWSLLLGAVGLLPLRRMRKRRPAV
jgi:hypothetical protein